MPIPDNTDEYLRGKSKQMVRTNRTKCLKEIMDIYSSAHFRQGRPMSEAYLNKNEVLHWASNKPLLYGVFNSDDILKAYTYVPVIGDPCIISRLLGHDKALNDGVMYLLISGVVSQMVSKKSISGYPNWFMYDTFFGAQEGLRYFKERLGFKPYKVLWKLG